MDIHTLLLQINTKLDLLLKMHGITQNHNSVSNQDIEKDYEYGRELARQMGSIRSDEK